MPDPVQRDGGRAGAATTASLLDRAVVPARLSLIVRGRATIAYNPACNQWHRTDETTAELLRWLRAGRPRGGLAGHLARRFPELGGPEAAEKALRASLEWALLRQLLHLDVRPPEMPPRFPDRPLATVYWICTQACNLRCTYCYQDALVARPNELTTEEGYRLIDQVVEVGASTLVFTGGEPFSRRDLMPLARYAKSRGLRVNVITNGHFITEKSVGAVAEVFDLISVSLDHMVPEHHDRHRGEGSWRRAATAVRLLVDSGVRVDVNSVLSRLGLADLKELLKLSREQSIGAHRIMPRFPMGRGALNRGEELTPEDMLGLDERMSAVRAELAAETPAVTDTIRSEGEYTGKGSVRGHCGAGLTEISVDPEGWAYPCKLLQYDQFRTGNIRDTPLVELYGEHPAMVAARQRTSQRMPVCKTCVIRNSCGGGCRGIQYSFTTEADGADPLFCAYLRRTFEVKAWRTTGGLVGTRRIDFVDRREPRPAGDDADPTRPERVFVPMTAIGRRVGV